MEVGVLVGPPRALQTRAAVEKCAAVWISEKGCPQGVGSGAGVVDWELRAELSHKPGHFYIVCAVFLWTNQGLSCLTRLFTPAD